MILPFGRSQIKSFPSQFAMNSYIVAQIMADNTNYIFFAGNPRELCRKKACSLYESKSPVAQVGQIWENAIKSLDSSYVVIEKHSERK
jgi:hypothetical protein